MTATSSTIRHAIIAGLALGITVAAAPLTYKQVEARARWIDLNKDGVLDASELATAKRKYGKQIDTIRISTSDANRDGRVTVSEAVHGNAFGEWQREITTTRPNGTATVSANGNTWKTEDGRAWEVDREGTNHRGVDWNSQTTGQGQKTDSGHTWSSQTTGSTADGNRSWETDRNGERIVNDDGTITVVKDFEKTLDNGNVITGDKETTITKTEDGREWETEANREGPKGESSWTATGSATQTDDGREVVIDREGDHHGKPFTSHTEGTVIRDGDTIIRDFETTRNDAAERRATAAKDREAQMAQRRESAERQRREASEKREVASRERQARSKDRASAKSKDKARPTVARSKGGKGGNRSGGRSR